MPDIRRFKNRTESSIIREHCREQSVYSSMEWSCQRWVVGEHRSTSDGGFGSPFHCFRPLRDCNGNTGRLSGKHLLGLEALL